MSNNNCFVTEMARKALKSKKFTDVYRFNIDGVNNVHGYLHRNERACSPKSCSFCKEVSDNLSILIDNAEKIWNENRKLEPEKRKPTLTHVGIMHSFSDYIKKNLLNK